VAGILYVYNPPSCSLVKRASCLIKRVPLSPLFSSLVLLARPLLDFLHSHLRHCRDTIRTILTDVSPLALLCSHSGLLLLLSQSRATSPPPRPKLCLNVENAKLTATHDTDSDISRASYIECVIIRCGFHEHERNFYNRRLQRSRARAAT
jgi:hypothetical protein